MSLAYPGAYPLEKTDELVKAVCAKEEARASSHFSVGSEKEQEETGEKKVGGRENGTYSWKE